MMSMSETLRKKIGYPSIEEKGYIHTIEDDWDIVTYDLVEVK